MARSEGGGSFESRRREVVRNRLINETKPLGMALVLSKVNMRGRWIGFRHSNPDISCPF